MSSHFDPYVIVTGDSGTVPGGKTDVILAPVHDGSGHHVLVLRTDMGFDEVPTTIHAGGPTIKVKLWDLQVSKLTRDQLRDLRTSLNRILDGDA